MENVARKQNFEAEAGVVRRTASSYRFEIEAMADRRMPIRCSRCEAVAAVIDSGVVLCGQCYLVEALRREAVASPSERARRAAAALRALRRILEDDASSGDAPSRRDDFEDEPA
jgi:hypothetical protein